MQIPTASSTRRAFGTSSDNVHSGQETRVVLCWQSPPMMRTATRARHTFKNLHTALFPKTDQFNLYKDGLDSLKVSRSVYRCEETSEFEGRPFRSASRSPLVSSHCESFSSSEPIRSWPLLRSMAPSPARPRSYKAGTMYR